MNMDDINIRENPVTHGYCCDFYVKDKKFYADVSKMMFCEPECMIFEYNKKNKINWMGVYTKRPVDVSKESLLKCIKEFAERECGS